MTLNAAATLAAQGELELRLVMLAGALGAVIGDSCLYWIARSSASYIGPKLKGAKKNEKIETALAPMGQSARPLIVGAHGERDFTGLGWLGDRRLIPLENRQQGLQDRRRQES